MCDSCCPVMNDCLASQVECVFRKAFCDARILPCIGYPSKNNCVMTLTHTLSKCAPKLSINGLTSKSLLANNSFYSGEVSDGQWLNLYTVQLPNVPGKCGSKSSVDIYTTALANCDIKVDNIDIVWKGSCPSYVMISSKAIGMNPLEFATKQVAAINNTLCHFS